MRSITTIITCMSDAERPFLARSLASVQRQSVQTKTILCVADTNDWVGTVPAEIGAKPRLMRLPLSYAAIVRNQAVAAVESDLVAFLDSDDLWRPDKLRRQVEFLADHDLDVVAAKHILIREDGSPFFFGFAKNMPMTSSWLGRTVTFRERPFEEVPVGEDVLLWERLQAEVRCDIMEDFLIRYRVREVSLSSHTPTKERKLTYARRSQLIGMRPMMLGASYAANIALRVRSTIGPIMGTGRAESSASRAG